MRAFDRPGRSAVIAENGMAATSHALATSVAVDILRRGGNAVDASIAAAATLCVVEPHMTGIGGDMFAIVAEPDGTLHGLNGSGRAPAGVDAAWYRGNGFSAIPEIGPHAITVPGAVKGWETLHRRFGAMEFAALLAPATAYAENGFAVHARVAWDWARQVEELRADEGGAMHCLVGGTSPKVGSRFAFPALARTLRTIAAGGADAFYTGQIGEEIVRTVRAKGGFLSLDDLAAVEADWVELVSTDYRGHRLHEIPPNGQGITALILLNVLKRLELRHDRPLSAERLHGLIEAARLAYSVRDHLVSDPATMTVDVEDLLSDGFADSLAARFRPTWRNPDLTLPPMPKADTVYLTVVDRERRMVSFINSLYDGFGSKVVTPISGVALQNRGACFNLIEGHPNEIGPGKRPMHTIIPAMVTRNGKSAMSYGVMGGDYQPMGHAHVLSNMLDSGMDAQQAVDHPRIFWDEHGALTPEGAVSGDVLAELALRGHAIGVAERPHGGAQMVLIDEANGFLVGASDPRKDGCAMGW